MLQICRQFPFHEQSSTRSLAAAISRQKIFVLYVIIGLNANNTENLACIFKKIKIQIYLHYKTKAIQ